MIGKLFKYEFKKMLTTVGKATAIIVVSMLGIILLRKAVVSTELSSIEQVDTFCDLLALISTVAVYFLCIVIAPIGGSMSYNGNIGTDTAYLMNTLPTTARERVLSSFLSNFLWFLICVTSGLVLGFLSPESYFFKGNVLLAFIKEKTVENPLLMLSILLAVIGLIAALTMATIMINTVSMRFIARKRLGLIVGAGLYFLFILLAIGGWLLASLLGMTLTQILFFEFAIFIIVVFVSYLISVRIVDKHINIA